MKKLSILTLLLIIFSFSNISFAEPAVAIGVEEGNAYIPDGTTIVVELANTVNSKKTFIGEVIEVNILEDIVINNIAVIEKGSTGYALVSNLRQPSEFGRAGGIEIQPQYVKTANWIKVPLTKGISINGESHKAVRPFGIGAAGVAGTAVEKISGIAAGISGLFLYYVDPRPGKDAEIPAGTKFIVTVDGNIDLKTPPDNLEKVMLVDAKRKGLSETSNRQNWTGTYNTNRGKMTLTQHGTKVSGWYERNSGKIEGFVKGNKLVGTWNEDKSDAAPSGRGFFEFTASPAGKSVIFFWRNDYSENWLEDTWAARLTGL